MTRDRRGEPWRDGGGRIAGRLLAQGNVVHGTDRTKAKADALIPKGLVWCDNPRTTAQGSDIVLSMVTDGDALDKVTAVGSPMLQARAALLHDLPDNAWFDVAMMEKDPGLALDYGHDDGLPMPSTTVADQMLSTARRAGNRDIAVVFRVLSEMVAAPLGGTGSATV